MMRYLLAVVLLCLCGPYVTVYGNEIGYVFEVEGEIDQTGLEYRWDEHLVYWPADLTVEEEASYVFQLFFQEVSYCIPEGVKLLGVKLDGGSLTVNVSDDILLYGGSAYERALIAQCLKTASVLPDVERLTLLIEGRLQPLAEGSVVEELAVCENP